MDILVITHAGETKHVISCDGCGVLIDLKKAKIPPIWEEYAPGSWQARQGAHYDGDKYVSSFNCPVCKHEIILDEEYDPED